MGRFNSCPLQGSNLEDGQVSGAELHFENSEAATPEMEKVEGNNKVSRTAVLWCTKAMPYTQ